MILFNLKPSVNIMRILFISLLSILIGFVAAFLLFAQLFGKDILKEDDHMESITLIHKKEISMLHAYTSKSPNFTKEAIEYIDSVTKYISWETDEITAKKYTLMLAHARLARIYYNINDPSWEGHMEKAIQLSNDTMDNPFKDPQDVFLYIEAIDKRIQEKHEEKRMFEKKR